MKSVSSWVALSATLVFSALLSAKSHALEECLFAKPCIVGDRSYHVLPPDSWDGKTPLPVLMHFHGWKRSGKGVIKNGRVAGATRKLGVLLVAPNGLGRSWRFWQASTEDVPFAAAVLDDVAKRFPIEKNRIFVSGYSWGSSMAWRFACQYGDRIAALLGTSGTLPSQDEKCPTGPVHVRHTHGTADTVMDFPYGPDGDATWPVKLWRDKNGCADKPSSKMNWTLTKYTNFVRHVWKDCSSGKEVILDVHERGHFIPVGWLQRQLDEML